MLKREDFAAARARLDAVLDPTPLQYSRTFSNYTGHRVWVKPENLQRTGAFKVRGAFNKLAKLCAEEGSVQIVTASSGNHAAAVAWAASHFAVPARVVMPEDASRSKLEAVRSYGGEVTLHGRYADERKERAREIADRAGAIYVDSTDDEDVIEGQGTCALDILAERPDVDVIVGPVGGGGLMAGITRATKASAPGVQTVAVEPIGSSSMYESVRAGRPVEVEVDTMADGLRTRIPGQIPFSYVSQFTDRYHRVGEDDIFDATLLMLERMKLLVEPSGAVALAGVLDGAVPGENRNVVVIATGGNVDLELVAEMIGSGMRRDWGEDMRPV